MDPENQGGIHVEDYGDSPAMQASLPGDYMGNRATDTRIGLTGIYIIRLVDGRQVEWWLEADFMSLMQELGVISVG